MKENVKVCALFPRVSESGKRYFVGKDDGTGTWYQIWPNVSKNGENYLTLKREVEVDSKEEDNFIFGKGENNVE